MELSFIFIIFFQKISKTPDKPDVMTTTDNIQVSGKRAPKRKSPPKKDIETRKNCTGQLIFTALYITL